MSPAPAQATPRWITEGDVTSAVTLPQAIDALRRALAAEAAGQIAQMVKTHTAWDGATLHAIGAAAPGLGLAVTKTWAHTPGGANPLVIVLDPATGQLRAVIEAFALGQLRTAAASGVATDALARPDASRLAVFGTGRQALGQVAAVCAVRPIRTVAVWGRDAARARTFARLVHETLAVETRAARDVADAAAGAHVLTLVTRASEAFLAAGVPEPGAHVNAVGAIVPSRIEFEPCLLARCALVSADSVPAAAALSQELRAFYGDPHADAWRAVRPLAEVVTTSNARPAGAEVTLFKAMGTGLADLAVAAACLRQLPADAGRPLQPTVRATPQWRSPPVEAP